MTGEFVFIATLGLVAGLSIGCIGIGGIIVVPALFYLAGIPVHVAIAAAMMGYLLTGLIGTAVYAANKSINWAMAGWLCAGAMPGALAGAWMSNKAPGTVLEFVIGLLTIMSGLYTLAGNGQDSGRRGKPGAGLLVGIGGLTGVLSALTGTGGPLVLVPVLLWLHVPTLTAIGLAQAVQLPVAALASVGNFAFGSPDIGLGILLAVSLAAGSYGGARLAHSIAQRRLKMLVATVLVLVGLAMITKIALRFV